VGVWAGRSVRRPWPDGVLARLGIVMTHQFLSVPAATPICWDGLQVAAPTGGDSMGKVPDGFHYVRGHIRRNPKPRSAKRMSGWMIAGLVAAVWLWVQLFGSGEASTTTPPAEPKPTVSASAGR
jgi:hypothetical protein